MVDAVTDDLLAPYATRVTAGVDDPAVADAFARVPRHVFVEQVIGADGTPVAPSTADIYSDEALVTRLHDGWPSSSSSQPSLMARMLAALRLRPGLRVLEIGAGTGYNAALIAVITGAPVISVEVQTEVAEQARRALDRAGIGGVRVEVADGYRGAAEHSPYDRIIATVGVGGVPPDWLDQLAPGGVIVAPIEHGGMQPTLRVERGADGVLSGEAVTASGFMLARGPLHPRATLPEPLTVAGDPPSLPIPAMDCGRFADLCFWLSVRDRRVTRHLAPGYKPGNFPGVLATPDDGMVLIEPDALRPVDASPGLVAHARALVDCWHAAGAPPVEGWRCGFRLANGLWGPVDWQPATG
jgi:protein-L-isoaspartate(D-aspartate) O-methyltransferase